MQWQTQRHAKRKSSGIGAKQSCRFNYKKDSKEEVLMDAKLASKVKKKVIKPSNKTKMHPHLQIFPFYILLLISYHDTLLHTNFIQETFLSVNLETGPVLQLKCYPSACFVFFSLGFVCLAFFF